MNLTLFVDASFCHKTGAAGWGAWAIGEGWERGRVFGGRIDLAPATASEAEMFGCVAAIEHLAAEGALFGLDYLVLQADNLRVLQMLLAHVRSARTARVKPGDSEIAIPRKVQPTEYERTLLARVTGVLADQQVWLRHIKGHSGNEGRSWVNAQCDRLARKFMQERRREVAA